MVDYDIILKFIVIGDSNVGKSCILLRFIEGRFKNQHQPTLGVEFGSRVVRRRHQNIKLQIWDTAGQESFKSITRAYYKGSIGVLLVFDLTSQKSFKNARHWLREVKTHSHEKMRIALIGNKADLAGERQVTEDDIKNFIADNKIEHYYETSALNGKNIDQPFLDLTDNVLRSIEEGSLDPEAESSFGVKVKKALHPNSPIKIARQAAEIEKKAEERCAC